MIAVSRLFSLVGALAAYAAPSLLAQSKLLRFPDLHGDRVVFTYAGDLWTASVQGGLAARLTSHPGLELFAKFSPDGKTIAFTGQYDGDEQVYVIPATGGVPKQLTFYPAKGPFPPRWGYDNQVYGWTPDGSAVLFRSHREYWSPADARLYTVPAAGGLPTALPMPVSGAGDFSPDGKKMLYSPLGRDFRTWKRYQGGWAQDLYIFDLATHDLEPVAHHPRTERDPMWIGGKVYFASDRTGTLNLYEYDPGTKKLRALTQYRDWDVRWPSKGDGTQIVFERNGELHVVDTRPGSQARPIPIRVPDDGVAARPALVNAAPRITGMDVSPKGERVVFSARGEIVTAPIEKGAPRQLTFSPGAHDREPAWSPDGRHIAFFSDETGEEELYVVPQDGSGAPQALTSGGKARRHRPVWSPDSKHIAFGDKDGKLFVVTVADKKLVEVADEPRGALREYEWSPDSRWLAYTLSDPDESASIHIWSAAENRSRRVTVPLFDEFSPAWDPEGNYLYFLSTREYAPLISRIEWNYAGVRNVGIYALALRKDVKHPFPPESDEVTLEAAREENKDGPKKDAQTPKPVGIDFDGIEQRVSRAPAPAHNYVWVRAVKGHLLYVRGAQLHYGRDPETPAQLMILALKDRKETLLHQDVASAAVSADGKKVLVRQGASFYLYDAAPQGKDSRKTISTAGIQVERVPRQEWTQIFNEVWRRFRDYFYVKNMHGYDWEALRRQYQPWLEYVGHRSDLTYVISEMISELNVGHAYIAGGDLYQPERPKVALPGARFDLDPASGRYRIAEIYRGHNEEPLYRSPLTETGVDARVGDYVLAIDGQELAAPLNPYQLLRGKADRPVRLTLNGAPSRAGAREVVFQPIADETKLFYLRWVEANRAKVEQATGGKAGYLHIPDMAADGIREFIKWFYPQVRKEGLIVDVRGNGGGNVSSMVIERLRRELLMTRFSRNNDFAGTYPQSVLHGHLVCLLNQTSASDGDIFPAMFRQAKLGPLIGMKSWGGVVGITDHGPLMDGGTVNVPEFAHADLAGQWIIEGEGVAPDIVVDNDAKSVLAGRDPQLERGIRELVDRMKKNPKRLPPRPPDPIKTN
jgi:tricorn protease